MFFWKNSQRGWREADLSADDRIMGQEVLPAQTPIRVALQCQCLEMQLLMAVSVTCPPTVCSHVRLVHRVREQYTFKCSS